MEGVGRRMQKARTGRRGTAANLKMSSMSSRAAGAYRMRPACNNIVTPGTRHSAAR
jgi:hypothetical protein